MRKLAGLIGMAGLALGLHLAMVENATAAQDQLVMGMVLEPPHLDPTAGAAAARSSQARITGSAWLTGW